MEQPKKKRRVNESPLAQRINKHLRRIRKSIHRIISIKGNKTFYLERLQRLTATVNRIKEENMVHALAVAAFKAWQWGMYLKIARLLQARQKYYQKYYNPSNFEKRATLLKFLEDLQSKFHKLEGTKGLAVAVRQLKSDIRTLGKKMSELKAAALAEGMEEEEEEEADEIPMDNIDFESIRRRLMTEATTPEAQERREDLLSRAIWQAISELDQ